MTTKVHTGIATLNFFGARLKDKGANFEGDCPLCGKSEHLYANPENGLWDCKVCGQSGNQFSFLSKMHAKLAGNEPSDQTWDKIAELRKGVDLLVLKESGLVNDGKFWYLPVYNVDGKIRDLRRYDLKKFHTCAGCELQLWGIERLKKAPKGSVVHLCEGEWDGMAMRSLLQKTGQDDKEIVVALPGAGVLKSAWAEALRGMKVSAYYDNDDAGDKGATKFYKTMDGVATSMQFIHWSMSKPPGYDLRDFIKALIKTVRPADIVKQLKALLKPKPKSASTGDGSDEEEEILESITFQELLKAFEKRAKMTDDLRDALRVCAAVCMSIDLPGDPLWVYLIGAPGSGKTLILGATGGSDRCVLRSTLTGHNLVSGFRGEGEKDPSLIPQLRGKTFVCKDFTEVLTMPRMLQDEVFSTLRGAYDGSVQKHFGNGVLREYMDCRFAMLAGVTHAINGQRQASMGERFLKFTLRKNGDRQAEDVIAAAIASVGNEVETELELKDAFKRFLSKRISSGETPRLTKKHEERVTGLVQLIAFMRAQVERNERTGELIYRPEPEAGTRLAKQLVKLAMCLAVVMEKKEIDDEVYTLMERVALDTANGFHLEVVDAMVKAGKVVTREDLIRLVNVPYSSLSRYMEDLTLINVVTAIKAKVEVLGRARTAYTLSPKVERLWKQARGTGMTIKRGQSRRS